MAKNLALKLAIFESGMSQLDIEKAVGLPMSKLSMIVRGHRPASEAEQKALAKLLKRKRSDLFPSAAKVPEDTEAVA
jgi:transcriptional regulator with XRE-family HTH domain